MNPRSSFQRKIIYLVAIAVLLGLLSVLGRPATRDTETAKGSPGGKLARLRAQNGLSQAQLGQIDPTSETIKLATLGMRGVAANILWEKANRYKMKKDWTNLSATLEQITRVQPNFISVWRFQAWNLAYNVSAEFDDFHQRYRWVIKGINFLKRGIKYNQREPRLFWDVGWFIAQKIGRADESKQFRKLFKQDDDFHGPRELANRDNWLVGKQWFQEAVQQVDEKGASMKGMSPLIFRSDVPMCQMNYAEALEKDGIFGERAQRAWKDAAREWDQYGSINIPTSYGISIRLNDREMYEEKARKLVEKLDAIEPGLRERIHQEKRAELTDQLRQAVDTTPGERTTEQHELAAKAKELLEVTHEEVAARIKRPRRKQALKLAKEAVEAERVANIIRRYRQIVNFESWRLRAQVEQTQETLAARKLIYQGDHAFADGDLPNALRYYDEGLNAWRKVLDKFPELVPDETFGSDLVDIVNRYRKILELRDEPFPEDFILQDIVDLHEDKQQ